MRIQLVIEGFHLLIPTVAIERNRFSKGVVRFQVQHGDPRFPCVALQFLKETPPKPQPARLWRDPHTFDFPWRVLVQLQRAAAHRLLAQARHKQQSMRKLEFVWMRLNAARWVETGVEAPVEFDEILLDAPAGLLARWVSDGDLHHRGDQQPLNLGHSCRQLHALALAQRLQQRMRKGIGALVQFGSLALTRRVSRTWRTLPSSLLGSTTSKPCPSSERSRRLAYPESSPSRRRSSRTEAPSAPISHSSRASPRG